ncbi:sigma-54 interaction domain-containing protein [Sporomusa acidovorans]|uniref:Anaerobic nitric oxide reductase transcription regulator NorR n=1 Tax=Sporomusa acidovorans (strain ATCC 49682 / DSM 3132 / Mol) TaxID=1123286 RepID=A0ABZ3J840_SPOA4|nr:sigma 54-interacting transcriptional regulator [Sporomusa acidovorans]OZC16722.1 arginine utilization regulatory protein RocR [Sporomusa acidovorans DSM 3132]SDE04746.1 regulatory protein, Fis family [Sporomusa acidovorans]
MSDLLECILQSLMPIARITGGYATVTHKNGVRIKTVNSQGKEVAALKGKVFKLAQTAGVNGQVSVGPSQIIAGAEAWGLPLGDYVLAASNLERLQGEQELEESLRKALPFIARVAGGEAVLFDHEGRRIANVGSDGQANASYIGKISQAAQQAIQSQRPVIGESISVLGAVAVRIPITAKYGFGFNNEQNVRRQQKLLEEVKKFQYARYNFDDIVGTSEAINKVKSRAAFVAKGISSIIISGETGTGKELFAQSIHNASDRRSQPFIAVNCGALPESLIESTFFGYEEGAFTGAKKKGSPGAFEQANGGTIFLDEISEMDVNLQSKLLRVLQEREVTRLGGEKAVRLDVRVIASTNRNIAEMISNGTFRKDLYYRLNVVELKIPALRERYGDILALVHGFITEFNILLGKFVTGISQEAIKIVEGYQWPGNIRELKNSIEYSMNIVSVNESTIEKRHLPQYLHNWRPQGKEVRKIDTLAAAVAAAEKQSILLALEYSGWTKRKAAKLLGISTTTLWRKMVELGIEL